MLLAGERVGTELRAASEQLQHGMQHLGEDLRDEEAEVHAATQRLAKKLVDGGEATRAEIREGLSSFRDHLATLRKRLWPDSRTATTDKETNQR
jgi:hypothetical protein